MARVRQDDPAQVDSRRRRVDWPAETFLHKSWNPPTMIEMCMRKNDRVDRFCGNGGAAPVAFAPLLRSLKESAINENLKAALACRIAGIDKVFRSGDRSCRA